jgi:hypothetical protein
MKQWVLLTLLVFAASAGGVYLFFQHIKEVGYESCVLSIESEFGKALMRDAELSGNIVVTSDWRMLSEEEERILFDKFGTLRRTFDCKQFGEYANGEAIRGEKGSIQVRRYENLIRVRIEANDGRVRRFGRDDF